MTVRPQIVEASLDMTGVMRDTFVMQLRLTGIRWWMLKSHIALFLIRAAGLLLGVPAEISLVKRSDGEEL